MFASRLSNAQPGTEFQFCQRATAEFKWHGRELCLSLMPIRKSVVCLQMYTVSSDGVHGPFFMSSDDT